MTLKEPRVVHRPAILAEDAVVLGVFADAWEVVFSKKSEKVPDDPFKSVESVDCIAGC